MKIGIDSRAAKWYRGTGIGTYSYQLINCLNKIDRLNEYVLFLPKVYDINIPFRNNFSIHTMEDENKDNFWDEVNIPNIIKGEDLSIYHVPQNGVGLPLEKKCPFVITLHDVIPYKMPETVSDRYLKIFNDVLPKLIPLCDGIITVSNYSKQDIIRAFNFPQNKVYVTHLAAEEIYKPIDKIASDLFIKKNYGINGDYILYIGGFSPRKNILGIIEAFSNLINCGKKDIKLVIAGKKGISYDIYKKRTEELRLNDKVIFPGFIPIDHMPYLYNSAKLFVYPSFYEGFGLPPIEAMACGTPVITSSITSMPEILKDSAYLVDPYDVEELYNGMKECLSNNDLRNKLIQKGFMLSKSLSWEKTAFETLKIYENILLKKPVI